jgi:hypothetical protein
MPVTVKGSGGGGVTLDAGAAASDTTLTLPNVSGTVLQSGTAVTVAQGGTGLTSPGANGNVLTSNGSAWVSSAPAATGTSISNGTSNVSIGSSNGSITMQTAGTSAATIDTSQNFQFNSGYGSVATAYGCRAWVNFNGTSTVAIRASGNVTSITDNGTGSYTVNFTIAMPDRNYAVVQCAGNVSTNACYLTSFYTPATGSVRLLCRSDAAATIDADECNVAIFR